MIVNLFSPDGSRNSLDLSNYATIQLRDELARLPGVGDITYLGQRDYSMRLWLDPGKDGVPRPLRAATSSPQSRQQNIQVAAGQIGQPPVPTGQVTQYTITTLGRLADAEQFGNMIIKTDCRRHASSGLRDVGHDRTGCPVATTRPAPSTAKPSVALSIYQCPAPTL